MKNTFAHLRLLTLCLLLPVLMPAAALAQTGADPRPRAVIELFTSQGCSSCPPADKLMAELARDPGLIVLSLPVDYWDYLGWRDTLASPAFTARQKAYSAIRGDRQVYTPQAVINGTQHAVGSERVAIEKAIGKSHAAANVLKADVAIVSVATGYTVTVGAGPGGETGQVWLLPIVKERQVQIGRGENTGRSIVYVNVARSVMRIGAWSGQPVTIDVNRATLPADTEGVVALLQGGTDRKPGVVLGAARLMSRP